MIHIKISKLMAKKMEHIYFVKNAKVDKSIPKIIRQADHKDENLDENLKELKQ